MTSSKSKYLILKGERGCPFVFNAAIATSMLKTNQFRHRFWTLPKQHRKLEISTSIEMANYSIFMETLYPIQTPNK